MQIVCKWYEFASRFVEDKRVIEVGCGTGPGLGYLPGALAMLWEARSRDGTCSERWHMEFFGLLPIEMRDTHRRRFIALGGTALPVNGAMRERIRSGISRLIRFERRHLTAELADEDLAWAHDIPLFALRPDQPDTHHRVAYWVARMHAR